MKKYKIITDPDTGKMAIQDVKTGKVVSDWHYLLKAPGLIEGKTPYYVGFTEGAQYVFDIREPETPVSRPWISISKNGLIEGKTNFYPAWEKGCKKVVVFHVDFPGEPLYEAGEITQKMQKIFFE
jgi:hypothetical protein